VQRANNFTIQGINWLKSQAWLPYTLLVVFIPIALYTLWVAYGRTTSRVKDFGIFWIAGHAVVEGSSPYELWLERDPSVWPKQADVNIPLSEVPEPETPLLPFFYTPIYAVMVAPLGAMRFEVARAIWYWVQLLSVAGIVLGLLELTNEHISVPWKLVLIAFVFCWGSTRYSLTYGQNGLLPAALSVGSLWLLFKGRPTLAGILWGIALYKFTLTGSLILFFLIYRHYRVIAVALLVQILGFLSLSLLIHQPVVLLSQQFISLLTDASIVQQDLEGIVSLDGPLKVVFGMSDDYSTFLPLIFGGVVSVLLWVNHVLAQTKSLTREEEDFRKLLLINASISLGLLCLYHRRYDLTIIFLFFCIMIKLIHKPNFLKGTFPDNSLLLVVISCVMVSIVLMIPSGAYSFVIEEEVGLWLQNILTTFMLLVQLGVTLYLVLHISQPATYLKQLGGQSAASPR